MVRAEDSCPTGRGFESRRILDGCKRFASYYIKENLKIKVAKWGTPKTYLKKHYFQHNIVPFNEVKPPQFYDKIVLN